MVLEHCTSLAGLVVHLRPAWLCALCRARLGVLHKLGLLLGGGYDRRPHGLGDVVSPCLHHRLALLEEVRWPVQFPKDGGQ